MQRSRKVRFSIAILLTALVTLSLPSLAQVLVDPGSVRITMTDSVQRVSRTDRLIVDPRVIDEMVASGVIFAGNFCYPYDSEQGIERCQRTVGDEVVLDGIVRSYLGELIEQRPAMVKNVGARLAEALGLSFERAGWPSETANTAAVVDLGPGWQDTAFAVQSAVGPVDLGSGAGTLLLPPGRTVLIVRRPSAQAETVALEVAARSRTELAAPALMAAAPEGIGRVEPSPDLFCYDAEPSQFADATAVFNWGRSSFDEPATTRAANQAPFTRQSALEIRVADETGGLCGPDCLAGLGTMFAQAIAVWRGGCERCDENALAVIKLGPTVWLDWRIANRVRRAASGETGGSLDLASREADETQKLISPPTALVPQTSIVAYEEATGDAELTRQLCGLQTPIAPWVQGAQAFLCKGIAAPSMALLPTLTLKPANTRCGSASAFIACGLPGGNIEVTSQDVVYTIQTPHGPQELATSEQGLPIDLRSVILHEVGHWFGVPHAQVAGAGAVLDIMGETLGDGRNCVSSQAMLMMNNASDLRWPYRVTEGSGLRRPRAASR